MASLVRLPSSPRCLFCLRRIVNSDISDLVLPFRRQLRGPKKGRASPTVLNVRLLVDTPGYGPEGAVIPVAPGRMRNIFYPNRVAAYVSEEQLRDLREREIPIERDLAFGKENPEASRTTVAPKSQLGDPEHFSRLPVKAEQERLVNVPVKPEQERLVNVRVEAIAPQEASDIMSLLPQVIQFYRTPIPNPQLELSYDESPSPQSGEGTEVVHRLQARPVLIYGSVSTADIADKVKAVLYELDKGERIVLGAEDITIMNSQGEEFSEETARLKVLGDFRVAIRVRNGETVNRTVRIRAEASS